MYSLVLSHGMLLAGMLSKLSTGMKGCSARLAFGMLVLVLLRMDAGVSSEFCLSTERGPTRFALEQFLHAL